MQGKMGCEGGVAALTPPALRIIEMIREFSLFGLGGPVHRG
jgi:hypothetical protein